MKNNKRLLLLALMLTAALLLSACGAANNSIEGKWTATALAESLGMKEIIGDGDIVFEYTKDGKVNMTVNGKNLVEEMKEQAKAAGLTEEQLSGIDQSVPQFAYRVDGSKLVMISTIGDQTSETEAEFKVEGDKLTITNPDGQKIEMTRAK